MLVSIRNFLLARSLTDIVNYSYKIGRLTKVITHTGLSSIKKF